METDLNLFIDRNDFGVLVQVVFPRESDTTPVVPRAHMSHANRPRPVLIVVGPKGVAFVAPCLSSSPTFFLSLALSWQFLDSWQRRLVRVISSPIDSKRAHERVANIHGAARQGGLTQEIVVPKVSGIIYSLLRSLNPAADVPNLRNAIFMNVGRTRVEKTNVVILYRRLILFMLPVLFSRRILIF